MAFASPIFAADLDINCDPDDTSECVIAQGSGSALFNETNLLPGDNIARSFTISNLSDENSCSAQMSFAQIQQTPSDFLDRFTTNLNQGATPLIGPMTFAQLLATPTVELGELAPGETLEYNWLAHFISSSGNMYQNAQGSFDFAINVECLEGDGGDDTIIDGNGPGSTNEIIITKETNTTVVQSNQTTNITYIIIVQNTGNNTLSGNTVVDLPPEQFSYVPGSWTSFSSRRGNLRILGITPEPVYSSPGTWELGELEPGEIVTLTYQANIPINTPPGVYPDLAYAYGTNQDSLVFANQTENRFVGTQVEIGGPQVAAASYNVADNPGQVLGAIDQLPATGMHFGMLILALGLMIIGGLGLYQTSFGRRSHD